MSAYALFFRDTQASIKGQNPNASFGEVSKIVASMWDVLAPDHKNVSISHKGTDDEFLRRKEGEGKKERKLSSLIIMISQKMTFFELEIVNSFHMHSLMK